MNRGYTSTLGTNTSRGTGAMNQGYTSTLKVNTSGRSAVGFKAAPGGYTPAAAFSPGSISSDASSEQYLSYLREATAAAKDYLNYLEGATKAAKDYLEYFERAKNA
jgi:hypothetical protein